MRALLVVCVTVSCLSAVISAPSRPQTSVSNSDGSAEQELIRHHHATVYDSQSSFDDGFDSSPIESVEEEPDQEEEPGYDTYDEEDLYDITVSDVIKDVLSTLNDHPEIVKKLIESEKEKLAMRLAEVDENEQEAELGDLADFQRPSQQLSLAPKAVEKKAGRSGMPVQADAAAAAKRQNEVIDENYPRSDVSEESREFQNFMNWPKEGGEDDGMFDDEKSTSGNDRGVAGNRHSQESEIDENQADYPYSNVYNLPYRLPFLNRFGPPLDAHDQNEPSQFTSGSDSLSPSQQIWDSHSVPEDSDESDDSNADTSDMSSEERNGEEDTGLKEGTSDNSESELARLLHQT